MPTTKTKRTRHWTPRPLRFGLSLGNVFTPQIKTSPSNPFFSLPTNGHNGYHSIGSRGHLHRPKRSLFNRKFGQK